MSLIDNYRPARAGDYDDLLALLPQLADFELPIQRVARELWEGDAELLSSILEQKTKVSFADVAVDGQDKIQGVILVTIREELLSHQPSAHLETIIVAPSARGQGLGRRLLNRAERRAAELGAESLTLHVFVKNERARSLYQSNGFDEELLRCIKWLD
jgi:ribosomal protein S18 acetylase RimI-like enzyme